MASMTVSDAEKHTSCHDEKPELLQQEADKSAECCEDLCECGVSGCNPASAVISSNESPFVLSNYSLNYLRDHYLSFVSTPSSPPPIA